MGFSVCFLSLEYFGWGKYGGIGKATREIAEGLVKRGVNVHALVPRGDNQKPFEWVNGVKVHSFPLYSFPFIGPMLKKIDADIYHSQDLNLGTVIGLKTKPRAKHMLTCQNPKTEEEWKKVNSFFPWRRKIYNYLVEPKIINELKNIDRVYCQANFIREKATKCYNLNDTPGFLPNPVRVKPLKPKNKDPQICFLGRFDGVKNPEQFFNLSKSTPDALFIAAGRAHDKKRDAELRNKYRESNLLLPGHVSGDEKEELLQSSWILVITSIRECLPVAFLEAAAFGCAILSPHDPDGFASRFGYHVKNDYEEGLGWLMEDQNWVRKGFKGYEYVKKHHEFHKVIDQHMKIYRELIC